MTASPKDIIATHSSAAKLKRHLEVRHTANRIAQRYLVLLGASRIDSQLSNF